MGSKRKLAKQIVDKILEDNPKTKYFYDLFGGGASVTFEALQRPQIEKVYYNEKNIGVYFLLKDIVENGIDEKYYQWVDRETFNNHKNDENWFGGFLQVVWSFGNNQRNYLYGKHIENYKRFLHQLIVFKDVDALKQLNDELKIDLKVDESVLELPLNERRLTIMRTLKQLVGRTDLQNVERVVNLERILQFQHLTQLKQLQNVEEVTNLFSKLELSNLSYDEVKIKTPKDETIIYLDPPYRNTKRYKELIDFDKLDKWLTSNPYRVYLSEYEAPFEVVMEMNHRSSLSATNNSKKTIEKLFVNRR